MNPALGFLVGQMIGATVAAMFLAAMKKWRWVLAPYILLLTIWAVGYWIATSSAS